MPRAFTDAERAHIRERLLAAGREAARRTGFRRTPVEALTQRAGISKGAFYTFFDSKEALWLELLQEAEAELRAELSARVEDGSVPPRARLREVVRRLFRSLSTHPILVALADPEDLAWLERALPPGALEAARADDDRWFGALWARLVEVGAGDPAVDGAEFAALAPGALALAAGWRRLGDPREGAVTDWIAEAVAGRLVAR